MKRHAIFVDAGYVFAQGAVSILGRKSDRTQLKLNEAEMIKRLKFIARNRCAEVEILRVYWYDGARNGPTVDHLILAEMEDVKLRLGSINSAGEQKEVDSLLVTDLIELARNQSICDATLVASDSDLRIAVQIAQSFGVRVHLIGMEPSRVSQSPFLRREADTVHEISRNEVSKFLSVISVTSGNSKEASEQALQLIADSGGPPEAFISTREKVGEIKDVLENAIRRTLDSVSPESLHRLKAALKASNEIPSEYDRPLLGTCRSLLGRDLTGDERRKMRSGFKQIVLHSEPPLA